MGNGISCISPLPHLLLNIKVLHSDNGCISEFEEPIKVAEIMLEYPNQFVCHSSILHSGQRISPLAADDELRMGQLYILLPMKKLHGRFSSEELAFFASLVGKPRTGPKPSKSGHSNVTPLMPVHRSDSPFKANQNRNPRAPLRLLSLAADVDIERLPVAGTHQAMICRSKSWIPKLETISETSMSMAC